MSSSTATPLVLGDFKPIEHKPIQGTHINLRPLQSSDAQLLWPQVSGEENANLWTYMPLDKQSDSNAFSKTISQYSASSDPLFWAITHPWTSQCLGYISFLRIDNSNRTIEIGHVLYTKPLQRTTAASEAWFLLAKTAFEHGYRRLEWKCNALNEPSRRAALRYGHMYEGTFRQHQIVKGQNRDTAWYAILDGEWARLRKDFERWIDGANFTEDGRQIKSLQAIRAEVVDVSS